MTNKEAIEHLKNINSRYPCSLGTFRDECEQIAINLAITALEGNSQGEEWLDNFINKYNESRDFKITDIRDREKLLDELRPKGTWILDKDGFPRCTNCNDAPDYTTDFCSKCGADMRQEADNE